MPELLGGSNHPYIMVPSSNSAVPLLAPSRAVSSRTGIPKRTGPRLCPGMIRRGAAPGAGDAAAGTSREGATTVPCTGPNESACDGPREAPCDGVWAAGCDGSELAGRDDVPVEPCGACVVAGGTEAGGDIWGAEAG